MRSLRAASRSINSRSVTGTLYLRNVKKKLISIVYLRSGASLRAASTATVATVHEREAFEQMYVLLVFDQRAIKRRNGLARITIRQDFVGNVICHQQLQPIDEFGRRWLLL